MGNYTLSEKTSTFLSIAQSRTQNTEELPKSLQVEPHLIQLWVTLT